MKKLLTTAIFLAVGFCVGSTARAAVIGELDQDNLSLALNGQDSTVNLLNLSGTTLSDLATSVVTNDGMVTIKDNAAYYANDSGFFKLAVGTTAPTTIVAGTKLKLMAAQGKTLVVSNGGASSFLYNVTTGAKKSLSPKVKEISSASLTSNEKHLGLVGKNAKGKQRIFVAHGTLQRLTEFDLPPGAKSCSVITLAANGKTIYVGCTFANKRFGYALATIDNVTIRPGTKKIDRNQVLEASWLNNTKLVSMTQDAQQVVSLKEIVVANGQVINTKVIGKTFLVNDTTVAMPMSLLRASNDALLYNFIIATTDGTPVGTTIGTYNTKSSVDQSLYSGTRFLFLMEATL